jgi:hypothetical protein
VKERKEKVEIGCGRRNNGKEKKRKTNKMRTDSLIEGKRRINTYKNHLVISSVFAL